MATAWNMVSGTETWKEYISRTTITNDLKSAMQSSTRDMVGAISGQTSSILTGMNSMGAQISS